jgi:hypothetical protein
MAVNAGRKIAAAGMAGGMLALLAMLLVLAGLTLGLGARQDSYSTVSTEGQGS